MRRPYRRYLKVCGVAFLIGLASVGILNLVVDPFGAYRVVDIQALRGYRAKLGDRIAKAEMLRRGPWDVLILGSSRAQVGVDPHDELWQQSRVNNVALTATNLVETVRVMKYAAEVSSAKKVIFFVDFLMFDENRSLQSAFAKSRFNTGRNLAEYHAGNLLGAHATSSSWQVLKDCARSKRARYDESGHASGIGHRAEYKVRYRFERTLRTFLEGMYADYVYSQSRADCFRELVQTCLAGDTELTVVISPIHALQLEAIRQAGLWQDFERFKRDLVTVAGEQEPQAGAPPVTVWDFTAYAGPNSEAVPPAGDPTDMKWYWESSHYKAELGNLVLRRATGAPLPADVPTDGFGVRLTHANVEAHLETLRLQREEYARENPAEIAMVSQLAEKARLR